MPPANQSRTSMPRARGARIVATAEGDDKRIDITDPIEWCKYNEYLFVENRNILRKNKADPMRVMIEEMNRFAGTEGVHFYDMEKNENKSGQRACEEMANGDRDCELTAYFHYFVAKQNRKRAYDIFNEWRDNIIDYLDQRSDYADGQYLEHSNKQMAKVKENEKALKLMDMLGYWDFRLAGAKVWKSVCSDKAFFKK